MTNSPRWATVLFDLDGTLVDTIALILESYTHAFETVTGTARSEEDVRPWIGRPLRNVFEEHYPDHSDDLETGYVAYNRAHAARLTQPYDGVESVVRDLLDAGVRIGVVTSKTRPSAAAALDHVGLVDLVPLVATAEDTTEHKPAAAPLLHGAARLSTPVGRCAYVGDAVVDVLAAKAAGMTSIAVTWGAGTREHLLAAEPDHLVGDVPSLRALLLGDTADATTAG